MGYNTGGGQGQFAFCSKTNWWQVQSFPVSSDPANAYSRNVAETYFDENMYDELKPVEQLETEKQMHSLARSFSWGTGESAGTAVWEAPAI